MSKSLVKKVVSAFGYEIHRSVQEQNDLYDNYSAESLRKKCFYNIGPGEWYHRYWTNVDFATAWYGQYQKHEFINYDLMSLQPLPIESGKAEIIYSSQVIEHITDEAARNLFRESARVCGTWRDPPRHYADINLNLAAFRRGDRAYFHWVDRRVSLAQAFLGTFASELAGWGPGRPPGKFTDQEITALFADGDPEPSFISLTSMCTYKVEKAGGHINWWNFPKLSGFIREAGFQTVYRSGFGQSAAPPLRNTELLTLPFPGCPSTPRLLQDVETSAMN